MRLRKNAKLLDELVKFREGLVSEGSPAGLATFNQIEEWAGMPLPPSAYKHRAWWSNNDGNFSNSLKPWDLARLSTADVDMQKKTVWLRLSTKDAERARMNSPATTPVLERLRAAQRTRELSSAALPVPAGLSDVPAPFVGQTNGDQHPLRGALKGTLRIVAGTDLTKPADPDWADRS